MKIQFAPHVRTLVAAGVLFSGFAIGAQAQLIHALPGAKENPAGKTGSAAPTGAQRNAKPVSTATPGKGDPPIHGTWRVEWRGLPKGPSRNFGVIRIERSGETLVCDGNACRHVPEKASAPWQVSGYRWGFPASWNKNQIVTQDQPASFSARNTVRAGPRRIEFRTSRAFATRLRIAGNGDEMRGTWKWNDDTGPVIARRMEIAPDRIVAEAQSKHVAKPGATVRVVRKFDRFWWGKGNSMRGNRPRFSLTVLGKGFTKLWHRAWADRSRGLQIVNVKPVYAPQDAGKTGRRVIGSRISVVLWDDAQPGRHLVRLDSLNIPIDLVVDGFPGNGDTPAALDILDADSKEITRLAPRRLFRVRARFDAPQDATTLVAEFPDSRNLTGLDGTLGASQPSDLKERRAAADTVILRRTENKTEFISDPVLVRELPDKVGGTIGWIDERMRERGPATLIGLAGKWQVQHRTSDGRNVSGIAEITEDGSAVRLLLDYPVGTRIYRSVETGGSIVSDEELKAYREAGRDMPVETFLKLRLREVKTWPARKKGAPPLNAVWLPRGQDTLHVTLAEKTAGAALLWGDPPDIRISLQVHRGSDRQMQGSMSEDRRRSGNRRLGNQVWIKGLPKIAGIEVVEDQLARPKTGQAGQGYSMGYPFDRNGRFDPVAFGARTRTLFVYGENLPQGLLAQANATLSGTDRNIDYAFHARAGTGPGQPLERGWAKLQKRPGMAKARARYDAVLITAKLKPGVTPGTKLLRLNGVANAWPLLFSDQGATMRFVRDGESAAELNTSGGTKGFPKDPVHQFFVDDLGFLEIDYDRPLPFREITARLHRGSEDEIGNITLFPDPEDATIYRSLPLHFSADGKAIGDGESVAIEVADGDIVFAELFDPVEGLTRPRKARAVIEKPLDGDKTVWTEALRRVAACYPDDKPSFEELSDGSYARRKAGEKTHVLMQETVKRVGKVAISLYPSNHVGAYETFKRFAAGTEPKITAGDQKARRTVAFMKGDHAAAILIRDEFIKAMLAKAIPANRRLASGTGVRAFRKWSRNNRYHPKYRDFWDRPVVVREGRLLDTEVPLGDTLDVLAFARKHNVGAVAAEKWAIAQTRKRLNQQRDHMLESIARARAAGDCNIDTLMAISGHADNLSLVDRIYPRLVEPEKRGKRKVWVADLPARSFVRSLHVKGEAIAALEAYADLDKAVVAAELSLVGLLAVGVLTAGGYGTAAAVTDLGVTALDVGFLAVEGHSMYQAHDRLAFARGAEGIFGPGFRRAAESAAPSAGMTAVTTFMTAAGVGVSMRNLRNVRRVDAGRKLLAGRGGRLDSFDGLNEVQRTNLAAYFNDLATRATQKGGRGLSAAKTRTFKNLNELAKKNPGRITGVEPVFAPRSRDLVADGRQRTDTPAGRAKAPTSNAPAKVQAAPSKPSARQPAGKVEAKPAAAGARRTGRTTDTTNSVRPDARSPQSTRPSKTEPPSPSADRPAGSNRFSVDDTPTPRSRPAASRTRAPENQTAARNRVRPTNRAAAPGQNRRATPAPQARQRGGNPGPGPLPSQRDWFEQKGLPDLRPGVDPRKLPEGFLTPRQRNAAVDLFQKDYGNNWRKAEKALLEGKVPPSKAELLKGLYKERTVSLAKRTWNKGPSRKGKATSESFLRDWDSNPRYRKAVKDDAIDKIEERAAKGNEAAAAFMSHYRANGFDIHLDPRLDAGGVTPAERVLDPDYGPLYRRDKTEQGRTIRGVRQLYVNPSRRGGLRTTEDIAGVMIHEFLHRMGYGELRAWKEQLEFLLDTSPKNTGRAKLAKQYAKNMREHGEDYALRKLRDHVRDVYGKPRADFTDAQTGKPRPIIRDPAELDATTLITSRTTGPIAPAKASPRELRDLISRADADIDLGVPGARQRLAELNNIDWRYRNLSPVRQSEVSRFAREMEKLGVPRADALDVSMEQISLLKGATRGKQGALRRADVLADAAMKYGARPVSFDEFRRHTGLPYSVAKARWDKAIKNNARPAGPGDVLPRRLTGDMPDTPAARTVAARRNAGKDRGGPGDTQELSLDELNRLEKQAKAAASGPGLDDTQILPPFNPPRFSAAEGPTGTEVIPSGRRSGSTEVMGGNRGTGADTRTRIDDDLARIRRPDHSSMPRPADPRRARQQEASARAGDRALDAAAAGRSRDRMFDDIRRRGGSGDDIVGDDILPGPVTEHAPGWLSDGWPQAAIDRLFEPGRNLTAEELVVKADALLAGRKPTPKPRQGAANRGKSGLDAEFVLPKSVRDKPASGGTPLPANRLYGDRSMLHTNPAALADLAKTPRRRTVADPGRYHPGAPRAYRPNFDEAVPGQAAIDPGAFVKRRQRWKDVPIHQREKLDAEVRALIDKAAAMGDKWARRLQDGLETDRYRYVYTPGMPDNVAGMAFRKSDGHRFAGDTIGEMGLNPLQRNAETGKLELRSPEKIAETLIHEFVHTYAGPDKFQAVRLGDRFTGTRQKGTYNEARAFTAETIFRRNYTLARQLNGKPLRGAGDSAGLQALRNARKQDGKTTFGRAMVFRRNMEQILRNDDFYTRFYPTYEEQIANLSAFRGGSTPNIEKRTRADKHRDRRH